MFELLERGGLGRLAILTRGDRTLRTPAVLFVHRGPRPSPAYAEALFASERVPDPRLQFRVSGSLFSPRRLESTDDLPPTKGLPRSAADLDGPQGAAAGDLAVVTSRADLDAAKESDVVFLGNGVEYLRHPRDFAADLAHVRETLGPAEGSTTIWPCTGRCSSSGTTWPTVGSGTSWSGGSRAIPGTRKSCDTSISVPKRSSRNTPPSSESRSSRTPTPPSRVPRSSASGGACESATHDLRRPGSSCSCRVPLASPPPGAGAKDGSATRSLPAGVRASSTKSS